MRREEQEKIEKEKSFKKEKDKNEYFTCNNCRKRFDSEWDRENHVNRRHVVDVRPWCHKCYLRFNHKSNLVEHQQNVHYDTSNSNPQFQQKDSYYQRKANDYDRPYYSDSYDKWHYVSGPRRAHRRGDRPAVRDQQGRASQESEYRYNHRQRPEARHQSTGRTEGRDSRGQNREYEYEFQVYSRFAKLPKN